MGALPSMLGVGGANSNQGAAGTNFNASGVDLLNPATVDQANSLYDQSQQGIAQQQAFLNALQSQNGVQNQANVYNQLAGVASGQGPNPAQAMLANATGANVANQAALMAGQRGSGANVGLIARQAGQQGAAMQQQAAGQGAQMQAQQSLNAIGQMGGIAGQQVGQQANALTGLNQMTQSEQQNILNSINAQNAAKVGIQSNMNNVNSGIAQGVMHGQQALIGNLTQGAGTAAAMLAHGGMVDQPKRSYMADGGMAGGPRSFVGNFLSSSVNTPGISQDMGGQGSIANGMTGGEFAQGFDNAPAKKAPGASQPDLQADTGQANFGAADLTPMNNMAAKGGMMVPAQVSPGERYLPPKEVEKVAKGKKAADKAGEKIQGKAKVKGDSLKNDTVSKNLEEGGIVIPRSILQSKDPHKAASDFVAAILSRHKFQ